MLHAERLRTLYLFTVITACFFLITGCQQPEDVDCYDLSSQVEDEPIICTDGNEIQICMSQDSGNCGYYVNSQYIPCRSCFECDTVTDFAVAFCSGMPPSTGLSSTD